MNITARAPSWTFIAASVYGLAVIVPQYFMEERIGRDFPPAITHPEHFYGFIGVALAWQFAFLLIASDVKRYRMFMLPAVLEKLAFGVPAIVLHLQGRATALVAGFGAIDLLLAAGFVLAYLATPAAE
jgi:hypothetical protein